MKLGEKIRSARLNAGMTQADLAGDFITRNMLSQIENGLAMPSLQTALYIADRLGVDAGILFSERDNREDYFLTRKLPLLKTHFQNGEYDKCIELCSEEAEGCDEACILLAESYIKKAYDNFDKGKLRQALKYGETAVKYASKSVYSSDGIKLKNEILEAVIASISPYLKQTKLKAEERKYLIDRFNSTSSKRAIIYELNKAKSYSEEGRYTEALEVLKGLLKEKDLGVPFEYAVCNEYEVCCRELKDYENAYKYANWAKKLLEDMQQ